METVSLIIMAVGIAALIGIYILSRMSRRDIPKGRKLPPINTLMTNEGEEVTSIMEDQPARDGKTPSPNAQDLSDVMADAEETPAPATETTQKPAADPGLPPQLIMFVAAESEAGFAGKDIIEALDNSGLTFGDMGVYHRMVLSEEGEKSLFNVASGVQPWTLIPEELEQGATTPGLSMVLNLPSPISDSEAIHDFIRTAERITSHLGGVLKNQNQEVITAEQRRAYFAIV
ncbi:MAG: cell division protein ZipA C-terminal FtsZ-binding domain-containing protein [Thiolinea sp.]